MRQTREKAPAAIAAAWDGAQTNAEAVERLLTAMRHDQGLYAEIVAPFEREAASLALQAAKIAHRSYIWTRPTGPDNRVAALARIGAVTLLHMRLTSGVQLGDATAAQVADEAQYYRTAESNMREKAVFFEAVVKKIKRGKRVGESLTAAELEQIRDAG